MPARAPVAGVRRLKLPAGSSASVAKYVCIVASNMTQELKTEVIPMMLNTEADAGLKSLVEDCRR